MFSFFVFQEVIKEIWLVPKTRKKWRRQKKLKGAQTLLKGKNRKYIRLNYKMIIIIYIKKNVIIPDRAEFNKIGKTINNRFIKKCYNKYSK